jgi:hypothetical protein
MHRLSMLADLSKRNLMSQLPADDESRGGGGGGGSGGGESDGNTRAAAAAAPSPGGGDSAGGDSTRSLFLQSPTQHDVMAGDDSADQQ